QSRHQLPILVDLHEVIEDVRRNPRVVVGVCIHYVQFPPWPCDFFPHAAAAPPEGDEHEDDTTDDQLFHSCSLSVCSNKTPGSSQAPTPTELCHSLHACLIADDNRRVRICLRDREPLFSQQGNVLLHAPPGL